MNATGYRVLVAEDEQTFGLTVTRFLQKTGTRAGEVSGDGNFTVIEAECLGACGFATAVQVNDSYYENVTPEDVPAILEELDQGS